MTRRLESDPNRRCSPSLTTARRSKPAFKPADISARSVFMNCQMHVFDLRIEKIQVDSIGRTLICVGIKHGGGQVSGQTAVFTSSLVRLYLRYMCRILEQASASTLRRPHSTRSNCVRSSRCISHVVRVRLPATRLEPVPDVTLVSRAATCRTVLYTMRKA